MVKRIDSATGPRVYEITLKDGGTRRVPSVTGVLACLAKPQLIPWAAKMERALVCEAAADLYEGLPPEKMNRMVFLDALVRRIPLAKAHQVETEKAFEIGHEIHALIENRLREMMGAPAQGMVTTRPEAVRAFSAWETWAEEADFTPLHVEQMLWSERHGYAGTTDVIAEITAGDNVALAVGDWKSSKAGADGPTLYDEHALQVAAYGNALVEMGHAPSMPYGFVASFAKTPSPVPFKTRIWTPEEMTRNLRVFLSLLDVWNWQQTLVKPKKEKKT